MTILELIPPILLAVSLLGLVVFGVTYVRAADWRKTPPGRSLMYLIAGMVAVLTMSFIHLAIGPYPGMEFTRIAVYGTFTWSVIWIVRTLYKSLKLDAFYVFRVRRSPPK